MESLTRMFSCLWSCGGGWSGLSAMGEGPLEYFRGQRAEVGFVLEGASRFFDLFCGRRFGRWRRSLPIDVRPNWSWMSFWQVCLTERILTKGQESFSCWKVGLDCWYHWWCPWCHQCLEESVVGEDQGEALPLDDVWPVRDFGGGSCGASVLH